MDALNDIGADQRETNRRVRSDAEVLAELVKHPGWARYMALIESVAQNYHTTIMRPIENVLEMPKGEFAKGMLSGLSLATALPAMKVKEAQELRGSADEE